MVADGSCPRCGADLDSATDPVAAGAGTAEAEAEKVPWHFKLMVVALVVYLVWRFVQLGVDLFG
jgi:hypothetical protein